MGKNLFLVALVMFSMEFSTIAIAELLFFDDFESDTVGKEPSKWRYDTGDKRGEVIESKDNPANKVFLPPAWPNGGAQPGGHYIAGDKSWTDYIVRWDWMFFRAEDDGIAFRYRDVENYYLLVKPKDGKGISIYVQHGGC